MKTTSFSFDLPEKLIAQKPVVKRGDSRLLVMDKKNGSLTDSYVRKLPDFLNSGSLIVLNNTKVRKARIFARSETGGTVEFLFLNAAGNGMWEVITSKSKKQIPGKKYNFPGNKTGIIKNSSGENKIILIRPEPDELYFDKYGHIPLPPYIKRKDSFMDSERYQTVYSEITGSAAAPTAGLHFTDELLNKINDKGVETVKLTLHVGLGTFMPVRTENVEDHKMHKESYHISDEAADKIEQALFNGREITAVGTTAVRALESAYSDGKVKRGWNETDIFIYPGFKFNVTANMFTNFHTPNSTLLLMVSAFAGEEGIKAAYNHAIRKEYRFFSYGDAMYIKA